MIRILKAFVFMSIASGVSTAAGAFEGDWLAGCWESRDGDRVVTEMWMAPSGGMMLGASRTVVAGEARAFEHLRIVEEVVEGEERVVYVAIPSGQAETHFTLSRHEDGLLVFENPAHDFPQRIVYRRVGDDALAIRVEADTGEGVRGFDQPMPRVACRGRDSGSRASTARGDAIDALTKIVAARDGEALIARLAPDVMTGFGMESGKEWFVRRFRPADPEAAIWIDLKAILGATITTADSAERDGVECLPRQHSAAYQLVARGIANEVLYPVRDDVAVRASPDEDAPILAAVGRRDLLLPDDMAWEGWRGVKLHGQAVRGFVRVSATRSTRQPVLCLFEAEDGWAITSYVAFESS